MASLGRAVVAIGVFDGVHLGHQHLLGDAVAHARELGVSAVAITFDRDPDQIVTPEAAAPQLLTLAEKTRAILATGVDIVLVVPFDRAMAMTEPCDFLDQVLASSLDLTAVHVGADFRFGSRASGCVTTLTDWARDRGASVHPHALLEIDGEPVTSTRIRRLIAAGDVGSAAHLLGRDARVSGLVGHGRQQGRELGFPTANVHPVPYAALPADGVYAGHAVTASGERHPAAISVGTPPSFPEARDYLEAHLIGFTGDLYDRPLTLEFTERLRAQRAFGSMGELMAAIRADVDAATRLG